MATRDKRQKTKNTESKKQKVGTATSLQEEQEAQAVGRHLHISPTKVRDLLRLIRGKRVIEAETILKFSQRKGGRLALKVLRSAEANAGSGFDKKSWVVVDARADKGPIFRRKLDPKPRGRSGSISTPSTHLRIVIGLTEKPRSEKGGKDAS